MPHALGGCRLKLERAVAHVETLADEIRRFGESPSHELIRGLDQRTGEFVWRVDGRAANPSTAFSPLIGDVVHNLRSALDHLAWQLARRHNYGYELSDEQRTTFPIFKNRGRFWRKRPDGRWTGLSGASSLLRFPGDARRHVLAVQPYRDPERAAEHPLWALRQLWAEDRRRTLQVVGFATRANPNAALEPAYTVVAMFGENVPVVAGRRVGEVIDEMMSAVVNDVFRRRFAPYFEVDDWGRWRLTPRGRQLASG